MRFKKILLVTALALPMIAKADVSLTINNTSNAPSTVRITSGSLHFCSASFPGGVTPNDGKDHPIAPSTINLLCRTSGNTCEADMFPTNNCGDKSTAVGHAVLHLDTGAVEITNAEKSAYDIEASGTNPTLVTIKNKS